MRYLNWDILMFPDESKTPVPEFDIKCQVLPAEKVPNQKLVNAAGGDHLSSVLHTPTLTCFIPSMDVGHPFRISIHSWDAPKMSQLMASFRPSLDRVAFETRLFIDGQLKCQKVTSIRKSWPEVIETTETLWTEYPQRLVFPPFHPEILHQAHWDPAQALGRIKLTISEGVSVVDHNGEIINFNKLRDIVTFSFQHAPRDVLEQSEIAWPSAITFQKATVSLQQPDASAHAHSPTRSGKQQASRNIWKPTTDQSIDWSLQQPRRDDDPFVGPAQGPMFKPSKKIASDVSMADLPTTRTQSEMSDVKLQQPDFHQQVNRAAIDEIVRALTPRKRAALLNALSPTDLSSSSVSQKTLPHNRVMSVKAFDPMMRPRSVAGSLRRSSNESRRSASGTSTVMSWDETPTLGDLWSNSKNNDFPGLLPSIHNSAHSDEGTDSGRRRKRSPSQSLHSAQAGDAFARAIEEMSTSPCKKSPTPAKRARVEEVSESEEVDEQTAVRKVSKHSAAG